MQTSLCGIQHYHVSLHQLILCLTHLLRRFGSDTVYAKTDCCHEDKAKQRVYNVEQKAPAQNSHPVTIATAQHCLTKQVATHLSNRRLRRALDLSQLKNAATSPTAAVAARFSMFGRCCWSLSSSPPRPLVLTSSAVVSTTGVLSKKVSSLPCGKGFLYACSWLACREADFKGV